MAKKSKPVEPPRDPCNAPHCRNTLPLRTAASVGRPARYCSDACRIAGHRDRKLGEAMAREFDLRKRAAQLLAGDIIVGRWADTYQKLTGYPLTPAQVCALPELLQTKLFP